MKKAYLWLATLVWIGIIWQLTTTPDFHPSSDTIISFVLSNGGHFIFFGILAALLQLSFNLSRFPLPLFLTSLYGILIEFVQRRIPGRSFSLTDWSLDILGALVFLHIVRKYYL